MLLYKGDFEKSRPTRIAAVLAQRGGYEGFAPAAGPFCSLVNCWLLAYQFAVAVGSLMEELLEDLGDLLETLGVLLETLGYLLGAFGFLLETVGDLLETFGDVLETLGDLLGDSWRPTGYPWRLADPSWGPAGCSIVPLEASGRCQMVSR